MLMKNGDATLKFYAYKHDPKSKFDTGTVTVDGAETAVKVTCAKHAKFPAYTYLLQDGQLFYAAGDLRGAALATIATATEPEEEIEAETEEDGDAPEQVTKRKKK